MTKLLPCPFCMRDLEHDASISATFHPKIPYEEFCPLEGFLFASDRRDIIAAWNKRAHSVPETFRDRKELSKSGKEIPKPTTEAAQDENARSHIPHIRGAD